MTNTPIAHIYGKIEKITKEPQRTRSSFSNYVIVISDGSKLTMPPSAWEHSVSRIAEDDRILIDLENWEPKSWADVAIFRDGRFVTVFGIGKDACTLELARLNTLDTNNESADSQN